MTALTFDEAREVAENELGPSWLPSDGTFYVAPYGWEDDYGFHLVVGAREAIVDDDFAFESLDSGALIVDKLSGTLTRLRPEDPTDARRLDAMAPVGNVPADRL